MCILCCCSSCHNRPVIIFLRVTHNVEGWPRQASLGDFGFHFFEGKCLLVCAARILLLRISECGIAVTDYCGA
jgi:hypothetical protein